MPVIRSKKWALMLAAPVEALVLCGVVAVSPATAFASSTALIIGATGVPDPAANPTYIPDMSRLYFPFTACRDGQCHIAPVTTPEQLFPLVGTLTLDKSVHEGLDIVDAAVAGQLKSDPGGHLVIAGGSQGAIIAALEKAELAANPEAPSADQVEFVLFDNQTRPNGGLLSRFPAGFSIPALGISAQPPAPTDTGYHTIDVAMQYDGNADFPVYPINLLAVANAIAGIFYIHGTDIGNIPPIPTTRTGPDGYSDEQFQKLLDDPANSQTYGDTTYITIPTKALPILQPLRDFGAFTGTSAITTPLADLVEPVLRVLIETGYDRTIGYGRPTTFGLLPAINPLTLAADLINAGAEGLRQALRDLGLAPLPAHGPTQEPRTSQSQATEPAPTAVSLVRPRAVATTEPRAARQNRHDAHAPSNATASSPGIAGRTRADGGLVGLTTHGNEISSTRTQSPSGNVAKTTHHASASGATPQHPLQRRQTNTDHIPTRSMAHHAKSTKSAH